MRTNIGIKEGTDFIYVYNLSPAKSRVSLTHRKARLFRSIRLIVAAVLLVCAYQIALGKGSLADRYMDTSHRADTFVESSLGGTQSVPQKIDGIYLPSEVTELRLGSYEEAIGRVAVAMQQSDDGQYSELQKGANSYRQSYGVLSEYEIRQKTDNARSMNRAQLEDDLREFLAARSVTLQPSPNGLSDSEVLNLYRVIYSQFGRLPVDIVRNNANGGSIDLQITDDGSIAGELYMNGIDVGVTFRSNTSTTIQLSYVPKHNYPLWGVREFEGTAAHELGHALNLDSAVSQRAAVSGRNLFDTQGQAMAAMQRIFGTPQFESVYAQTSESEDIAEATRAVLLGDVYSPNNVRAFESRLGTKKLYIVAQLEYQYPGFTANALL